MTNSETSSAVQDSVSLVELASMSAGIPLRHPPCNQARNSSRISVLVDTLTRILHTDFVTPPTLISQAKPGAPDLTIPRSSLSSRIQSHSQLPAPSSIRVIASSSSV